jgi:hypothetical protein
MKKSELLKKILKQLNAELLSDEYPDMLVGIIKTKPNVKDLRLDIESVIATLDTSTPNVDHEPPKVIGKIEQYTVKFNTGKGFAILVNVLIPPTQKHASVTVIAFTDKGLAS